MTVDKMLELAEHILATCGPEHHSFFEDSARFLAQAVKDTFIPNTCGAVDPILSPLGVEITAETPGLYSHEEARAYATALLRKVDESEARDKKVQETPVL